MKNKIQFSSFNFQISIIFAVAMLLTSCATVERTKRKAEAALAIGEYAEAAALYKRAYQQTPSKDREDRALLAYKMGEAYRRYGNVARALGAYRSAERYKLTDTLTLLREAEMMHAMGDYKQAQKYYELYLEQDPTSLAAKRGRWAAAEAEAKKDETSPYTIKMATLFNSTRSDYCPMLTGKDEGETLYFSTTRRQTEGNELSGITGTKPGDIYASRKDERGNWKRPEAVLGGLNTEFDEGACCFSPDGSTMYLTVCRTDAEYPRMAEIWTSKRSDANWAKPTQLQITKDTLSSYAHPAISPDGRWLYFTSDLPGGYGGLDLWRMRLDEHGAGIVENLGPDINTEGDECFPSFRPNGELYFSSNGRTPSYGGLDIYVATQRADNESLKVGEKSKENGKKSPDELNIINWNVVHLPRPMNSQGDDFGITFEGNHNRGFFSSSRSTGGRGWDKIYSFSHPEQFQTVKGWVYEQDGYELPAAQVYMVGSDGTNQRLSVLSDGSFTQPVRAGVDYIFLATCPGYLNLRQELRPDSVEEEYQHVLQFPLPSMNIPVLVRGIFYEYNKATLTDSSRHALDRLAHLLEENPNITIELRSHCDYRGSDSYNDRLSQARADSVVAHLIRRGVPAERLSAKGCGEREPKIVSEKLAQTFRFLHKGDTLTEARILTLQPRQQEIANALNRRTEFRVTSATYGLFDEQGNLRPDVLKPKNKPEEDGNTPPPDDSGDWY